MDNIRAEILSGIIPAFSEALFQCDFTNLCEIRFRAGRPVMLYYAGGSAYLKETGGITHKSENAKIATKEDIERQLGVFCKSSLYAYEEKLREGFLTIRGGHRVGVSGSAITKNKSVTGIKTYSGLNIRIAREYIGCANACMPYILTERRILNSVIISPPGVGKTTLLRDIARQLSEQFKVTIVDERSELAGTFCGVQKFDVGEQTDVLDAFPKAEGMILALRSLSPEVIITDEVGTEEDQKAITEALKGGCAVVCSMHGRDAEKMFEKKKEMLSLFDVAVFLKRENGVPEVERCIRF